MSDYLSRKIRLLSFVAIILVFFQHAINFTGYIAPDSVFYGTANINTIIQYIFGYGFPRIAVPLFFFLSGYLFYKNFVLSKLFGKYISRGRTLVIPYISWNILSILFVVVLQSIPLFSSYALSLFTGPLVYKSLSEYASIVINHGVAFPLWFLYDLILYTLIAPIIYTITKYGRLFTVVGLLILWFFPIPLPPLFALITRGACFYVLGAYLAIFPMSIFTKKSKQIALVSVILWLFILILKTSMAFISFTQFSISFIDSLSILMGLFALWYGYDFIAESKCMKRIEPLALFTFFLYASHEPLLELMKIFLFRNVGVTAFTQILGFIVIPLVTITICYVSARVLQRVWPFAYRLLTGGR